jgi:uncharacterized oligopeptide transporter (OPT) family protein
LTIAFLGGCAAGAPEAAATPAPQAPPTSAPQAALISAIAQGVLGGNLDWQLIGIGAAIGVVVVIIDELLKRSKRGALPPLAVGMGIYLPMALTLLIPLGALLGRFYDKWAARSANPEFAERMGVLMATGLIVGESIFGVIFAGTVAATQQDTPFALVEEFGWAVPLSLAVFAAAILGLYWKTKADARSAPVVPEAHISPPHEMAPR